MVSCTKEEIVDSGIEAHVLPSYLRWFVEDARKNGVDISYVYDHTIILGFVDPEEEEYSGKSWGIGRDKHIEIRINKNVWNRLHALNRKRLMYHELGHDILNFGHQYERIMSQGTWYGSDQWDYFEVDVTRLFKQYREK